MTRSTKSKNSDKAETKERSRKAGSKQGGKSKSNKQEEDSASDNEESPQEVLAQTLISLLENVNTLRDQIKSLGGITKRAAKRTRKTGTASVNNAFTCQMGIPPPLVSILRNPEDGKKLNKKSTLSRPKLASAIMTHCKKHGTDAGKGQWKPDESLREALGLKKKDTINQPGSQKIISALYKEHNITRVPTEGETTGKKTKRQLKEDDGSDSESVQSEEAEAPKRSRKRSNA
jgi:hypothetical protein